MTSETKLISDMLKALEGAIGALEFSRDYHRDLGNEEQAFTQDRLDAVNAAISQAREALSRNGGRDE